MPDAEDDQWKRSLQIASIKFQHIWHFIMGAAILVVIENSLTYESGYLIGPHAITLRIDFRWQIQSFFKLIVPGVDAASGITPGYPRLHIMDESIILVMYLIFLWLMCLYINYKLSKFLVWQFKYNVCYTYMLCMWGICGSCFFPSCLPILCLNTKKTGSKTIQTILVFIHLDPKSCPHRIRSHYLGSSIQKVTKCKKILSHNTLQVVQFADVPFCVFHFVCIMGECSIC